MALIHVDWTETRTYCAELEIEDFDPDKDPEQRLRDAVGELDDLEDYEMNSLDPVRITHYNLIDLEGDPAS